MTKTFLGVVGPQITLRGQKARPQPPMGLAYILGEVERTGWKPILFDTFAEGYDNYFEGEVRVTGLPTKEVIERIKKEKPDAIGVSLGVSTDHDYIKKLVEQIKKTTDAPIILGGSQASLMRKEIYEGLPIEKIPADYVVTGRDIGSGEESIRELLKAIEKGKGFEKVKGIAYKKNNLIITEPVRVTEKTLANLQLPKRDLLKQIDNIDIYSSLNYSHTGPIDYPPYGVMHTSRGCGGRCTFCHTQYTNFDRTLIRRTLNNIFLEFKDLKERGVQTLSIEDDNFGGFTKEQTELAERILIEAENYGFKGVYFPNGMTIRSMINNDYAILRQLKGMADKGIKIRNSIPAESGSNETLKNIIRKPHSTEEVELVIKELEKEYLDHENIEIDTFFIAGLVGYDKGEFIREPLSSVEKTFELADKVSDLGMIVNIWWMKPNPNGPQYNLWRSQNPEEPFYKLQFAFPPGIWGTLEQEQKLEEMIRAKNKEMHSKGMGSKRPIYPVDNQ
jgi:radical SAM superfamily enzyme YgiQ (UPF0313 family)